MNYIMIVTAALLFSLQFMFKNGFQKECGSSWNASLIFSLYSSVSGLIVLLIINKFHLEASLFSIAVALIYSIVNIVLGYSSIKAFQYANLSVYSVFSMIGGMLLPFIYGIMCGEEFKPVRIICCILIVISVAMSINKGEQSRKAIKYYIAVFVLNGMVGVISKFHQSYTAYCVDSASFIILTKIVTLLMSVVLILVQKERSLKISKTAALYCTGDSVFNSIANLMLLIALLNLPASVQYPIVTGGVIIFSTIIDLLRKEKVTKKEIAAAGIAFISSAFMAL